MTERNPFDHKPAGAGRESLSQSGALSCEEWEEMLTEALDGLLPTRQRTPFDAHAATCAVCGGLLKEAKQGQEWLEFLGDEPEVPAGLVERIVRKTSGAAVAGPLALGGGAIPVTSHGLRLPVRRVVWDTRMLMTVAMAFFSLALTLNLTLNLAGVRLTNLRLSDFTPASLETNLTRGFYGAKGSLVRYYDNLRLVYEVESKMRELRRSEEMQAAPTRQAVPQNPRGNGHKNGGKLDPSAKIPLGGVLWGDPEVASAAGVEENVQKQETEVVDIAVFGERVRERGLA